MGVKLSSLKLYEQFIRKYFAGWWTMRNWIYKLMVRVHFNLQWFLQWKKRWLNRYRPVRVVLNTTSQKNDLVQLFRCFEWVLWGPINLFFPLNSEEPKAKGSNALESDENSRPCAASLASTQNLKFDWLTKCI